MLPTHLSLYLGSDEDASDIGEKAHKRTQCSSLPLGAFCRQVLVGKCGLSDHKTAQGTGPCLYQQEHRELRCWATPGTIWAPRLSDALLYWPSWQEYRRLGNQAVGEGAWQCETITTA